MDFGRTHAHTGHPPPAIPPDEPGNDYILCGRVVPTAVARVGLSTWGDRAYRGSLYPADAAPAEYLGHYGRLFSTVELSATFYGLPPMERLERWRAAVPPRFRFLPKVSREATHRRALDGTDTVLEELTARLDVLEDRRGPVLLQLPPSFAPTPENARRLRSAVAVLGPQTAVELRHGGWFANTPTSSGGAAPAAGRLPPAAGALGGTGATLCTTDTLGARDVVHSLLTAPRFVLRFVAAGEPGMDAARASQWADRINYWFTRGLEQAYVYVHLDDPVRALELVEVFRRRLAPYLPDGLSPGPATPAAAPPRPDGQLPLF